MNLTWLGHSAFHLAVDGKDILFDPFFEGNGAYPKGFEDRLDKVDLILVTHGHDDHLGDTLRLAGKFGATVVSMYEVCMYLGGQGIENLQPMNIGGGIDVEGFRITMVNAQHSAAIIRDGVPINLGDPAGLIVETGRHTVYHLGDTGIFSDLALIQRIYKPTVGLVPIGDRFTMGPDTAAMACNEFLELDTIIPCHYNTFGLIEVDPERFRGQVKRGNVIIPQPGEAISL